MGALSRRKGHNHERWVAQRLREAFPGATVRRSDQGFGAHEPDVVCEGNAPLIAKRIWWECYHGRKPDPKAKLEQAERDSLDRERGGYSWIPVVVWREHGSRTSSATLRYASLLYVAKSINELRFRRADMLVTVPFDDLLGLLGGDVAT